MMYEAVTSILKLLIHTLMNKDVKDALTNASKEKTQV